MWIEVNTIYKILDANGNVTIYMTQISKMFRVEIQWKYIQTSLFKLFPFSIQTGSTEKLVVIVLLQINEQKMALKDQPSTLR